MREISAIIFDLGGVILDIDQQRTREKFKSLGLSREIMTDHIALFNDLETGKISGDDFRRAIMEIKNDLAVEQIDEAWNAMLLDILPERYELLARLGSEYPIYLLSNTNPIHMNAFHQYLEKGYGTEKWTSLFRKIFLSYEIGLRKPGREIYEYVLKETKHIPAECLFLDDSEANLNGAREAGLQTLLITEPVSASGFAEIVSRFSLRYNAP